MAQPGPYGATPTSTRSLPRKPRTPRTPRTPGTPSRGGHHATPAAVVAPAPTEGHATVLSSVSNLANTIIGAGALAFPSAFASMGLIPGILSCVFSACTASFGLYLLSRCATMVGRRPGEQGRKASFNEVAKLTFGKGWATRLFDLAIAIKCFGVSVSYLIICKTLLPQVSVTFAQLIRHPLAEDAILLSQKFWLVVVMALIIPLSFLRTLDALRFTSQIALGTVLYLIIVVVGWFFIKGPSPEKGDIVLGRFGQNTLSSFPVQVFAYTCAQNLFPIYNELKDKSQARMNVVIGTSIGLAAMSYELLGIIGYLTFGSKVGSNIIAMYPATSFIIALGRFGIVLLVGLSYPLQCLPCRACVYHMTSGLIKPKPEPILPPIDADAAQAILASAGEGEETVNGNGTYPEEEEDDGYDSEDDPLIPQPEHPTRPFRRRVGDMPIWKFVVITVGILLGGFIIALLVDELEIVLGFVGSTGSTIISFILPGFFYFKLFRKEAGVTKWLALALAIYGLAVMSFCLTFNIVRLVGK